VAGVPAASPLLALPGMEPELGRIEAALRSSVETDDAQLTEIARHLILAGGKRLRPVLTMVSAQAGGGEPTDEVVLGGVACELVHLGSLYHDDVMDEAVVRRSVDSVNARWGNLRAILAGDFLLARASEIAASLGTEVAALLARTIGRLCEGQIAELRHAYDPGRPPEAYVASISGKTASLFAAACRIGGIVAGAPRQQIEALTAFGHAYGMVFQIADDVLDLTATEEQLGKPTGHDLVEGVYTLPAILTLRAGGSAAEELADLLGRPLEGAELDKALAIVRSNGGVREAVNVAQRYIEEAAAALAPLPPTPARDALVAGAAQLIEDLAA
jgi:heptaprenyl diphosphate synthase